MVVLQNKFSTFPSGMFDFNASQDGRFGWFLLTWHPETDPVLEEIQTQIKLDIRNSDLGQTSKLEIELWLKTFMSEFHWKLHATFRKTNLKEKGISLLLAVLFDHELYFVEFGRMLSGIVDKDSLQPAGRNWTNFHVKSLDEMSLLGMTETDIVVKIKRVFIAESQRFIVLPSVFAEKLTKQNIDVDTMDTMLQSLFSDTTGSYFILEGKSKLAAPRRPRIRRYQISALVIILITIFALLYMQFGNRWLESTARKIKLILSSKNYLTVEQIPQYLNIDAGTIKRQLKKIEQFTNQPARNIKLQESWQTNLNFLITAAPSFDVRNIYIASDNKLMAFDKNSKKLQWKKVFDANVREVTVIRGNLIVFLDNQQLMCLQNGNNIIWKRPFIDEFPVKPALTPVEIRSEDDPRINGSVLLVPAERGLYIYDVNSGNLLSEISFDKHLQYLSSYDAFDNCFYAVVADGIHCISMDVLN
jgi:hypothetical protein